MAGDDKGRPLRERFFDRIDKNGPIPKDFPQGGACWLWTGNREVQGYGRIREGGRIRKTHQVSWELHYGPIPRGQQVQHWCNVRHCCNPIHLYLGDHDRNMAYKAECGRARAARGEEHYDHVLTEEAVREARRKHIPLRPGRPPKGHPKGTTCRELAEEYGVTENAMRSALKGITWKDRAQSPVDNPPPQP
jgi:hypothetical protein